MLIGVNLNKNFRDKIIEGQYADRKTKIRINIEKQ